MWKKIGIYLLFSLSVVAQEKAATANQILEAVNTQKTLKEASLVKNIPFEAIGPAVMSGRVVALAVNPEQPTEFYVAYASGGVWHTKDNGISFTPIMDNAPTQNIGEIAVHWPSGTLWVGTGENNASRSSYAGMGLLKTMDNGKTWTHHGLAGSHHIGKILIHPNNPNHLVVGVTGALYTPNAERGVYVTTDGGAHWKKTLYINDTTGIIDMTTVPGDFTTQYATAWEKDRKAWNFNGSGIHSGIYKSTDAGQSWTKISTPGSGFPTGEGVGRIGVAAFDANTIYAIHDSQFRRKKEAEEKTKGLTKEDFKRMDKVTFLALSNKDLNNYLRQNGFQEKYRAENVKNLVRQGKVQPKQLATYLEDANSILFNTPVVGAEVYKSTDGGKSWSKTHEGFLDGLYFSYGYYFGHVHVAPYDANKIYIYGVPILTSDDGGKTFTSIGKGNVHSDHHALWINPKQPGHLINGNDGGVNITYNDGDHWMKNNSTNVGQFYAINVDYETPYNV
ncbi:MAG: WD40/YVTN/BNR-like repeat-containing protein, partial [Flavobacteriaceae bacterium]